MPIYQGALAAHETLGESPESGLALNNLGWSWLQLDQHAEAIATLERAAAVRERVLGQHVHTALTLQNLSTAYFMQGRFDAGTVVADRALSMRETILLGRDHVDVTNSLIQRAIYHQVKSELAEAETLAERALSILEKRVRPEDDRLTTSIEMLTLLNEAQARYSKALELSLKGVSVREAAFGSADPQAMRFLENAARNQEYLGAIRGKPKNPSEKSWRCVNRITDPTISTFPARSSVWVTNIRVKPGIAKQKRFIAGRWTCVCARMGLITIWWQSRCPVSAVRSGRRESTLKRRPIFVDASRSMKKCMASMFSPPSRSKTWPTSIICKAGRPRRRPFMSGPSRSRKGTWASAIRASPARSARTVPSCGHSDAPRIRNSARRRQLAINLAAHGPDHDTTAASYSGLAWVQLARGRWDEALANYAHATEILIRRNRNQSPSPTDGTLRARESEIGRNASTFLNYIHTAYWGPRRLFEKTTWDSRPAAAERTFALAQRRIRPIPPRHCRRCR